jgi:lycopene cyclase domain-containing protein
MFIVGLFFIAWDVLFTDKGVWGFNPVYITGINIFNLPIEEVLFFVCVPYSCVFIYEVCNAYIKQDLIGANAKQISIIISLVCLVICVLFYDRTYTIVNVGISLLLVLFATFMYQFKNLGRFYVAYVVSLIPFLICNGILTALPVVTYNNNENMALRIYTIPLEDTLYCLSLLLSTILLMDYFKQKHLKKQLHNS